jgi:hypothetical protein
MAIQKYVSHTIQAIYKILTKVEYLSPTHLRLQRSASVVMSQVMCHRVIVDVYGTYSHNISIDTIMVLATFA